jgi:DNA modification methylase
MNCVEGLKLLDDNSIDSIVTDPPYGIEFMGKEWDSFSDNTNSALGKQSPANQKENTPFKKRGKPINGWSEADRLFARNNYYNFTYEWAKECLRVLKPGGFLLVFGSPRMYHRMTCAIEDVGFSIRDCIMWLYGSGFPKSMDISKAIDKQGEKIELFDIVRDFLQKSLEQSKLSLKDVNVKMGYAINGSGMAGHWFANISQQTLPTKEQWFKLKEILNFSDDLDEIFNRCVTPYDRPIIGKLENPASSIYGNNMKSKDINLTTPNCDLAKQWEGWGTALKPAHEPIVVARKPLSEKTVADNVLKWGTGGINIDGCRIKTDELKPHKQRVYVSGQGGFMTNSREEATSERNGKIDIPSELGRFPANVILDEEAGKLLDEQSGNRPSGKGNGNAKVGEESNGSIKPLRRGNLISRSDSGGASRFFYCAKASKKERGEGNNHPTVKPLSLIKYLITLVTPPNGIVLDPFMGSGTTALASLNNGFNYIGFELDENYVKISEDRIKNII